MGRIDVYRMKLIQLSVACCVGLQTPPDESSLPEPTLEQAAAAAKLQTAMEAVREKFTTQLCSLDLQLLELARAQGLPTDEQEAAKDSGAPALMKARNDQWAELLEVRLDRVAAIQVGLSIDMAIESLAADRYGLTRRLAPPHTNCHTPPIPLKCS
jgi:hypothetical protein